MLANATNCNSREAAPASSGSSIASVSKARVHTYGQILKSSALIGGASMMTILIGIVRTKVVALLLGPAGFGLMGLYGSITELAQSIAGMGLNSSGVRQIAAAAGSGDRERIARTATVLRRTAVLMGFAGAVLLLVCSRPVSVLTFGTEAHTASVALLGLAVFFSAVAGGQTALIQGLRRISDLARMGVLGALLGMLISITLVFFFRERGVAPALVCIAASTVLTSWWYSRKAAVLSVAMSRSDVRREAAALLKLGFAFMASGLLTMGAAYVIRLVVIRRWGLEAAGLYQSAWTLGGLYVGFILQSMAADFFPRLTASAQDNAECNRLVNEQAQISLLLAGPGVLATLTFAPLVIGLFYSAQFQGAVPILRWISLGMTLRVVAWPMGFIVLAKGWQKIFFWTEMAATLVHVGLAWLLVRRLGPSGAGVAFFGLYLWQGFLIYFIVRRLSGFYWSPANRRVGSVFLLLVGAVAGAVFLLHFWLTTAIGSVAVLLSGFYSLRMLVNLVPSRRIPFPMQSWLNRFGLLPPDPQPRSQGFGTSDNSVPGVSTWSSSNPKAKQ